MPASPTTQQMGEKHEVYLAEVNGGTRSKASGSQWDDPADGRSPHDGPLAFAWDGKSTRGKGITITLDMIAKITEQALSERPQIGLRWYANDNLDQVAADWVAVRAEDWAEVLATARELAELDARHASPDGIAAALDKATRDLEEARRLLGESEERYRQLAEAAGQGRFIPPPVPALPWTMIFQVHLPGRTETSGMHYAADGSMTSFKVGSVRVERSTGNLPRLIVNDRLVTEGDLYVDGRLHTRASRSNPSLAAG